MIYVRIIRKQWDSAGRRTLGWWCTSLTLQPTAAATTSELTVTTRVWLVAAADGPTMNTRVVSLNIVVVLK